jgi:hypothetical protein
VLFVFFECQGDDKEVVQVDEIQGASPQNVVYEAMKCLGGFAQAEGHEGEFE